MKKKIFLGLIYVGLVLGLTTGCNNSNSDISNEDLASCFDFDSYTNKIVDFYCYKDNEYGKEEISNLIIPDTINSVEVLVIGDSAFTDKHLKSVTLPSTLKTIEKFAFSVNELTSIHIPNSTTEIGVSAFEMNKIETVKLGNSITVINDMAFQENQIKEIIIPESVISIGAFAFADNQLVNVTIPNNVKTIGKEAFMDNNLETVILGNNVENIDRYAFYKDKASNSNVNLNKIINPTNKEFNWTDITGAYIDKQTFITGTIKHELGNIIVE